MSIRLELSKLLKENKKLSGCTYADIKDATGLSTSSIRYALNGGKNVGLDVYEKMFKYFELSVKIEAVDLE